MCRCVSLSLSLCVSLWLWLWLWCACAVRCGWCVEWHAEKPPCVHPKRPRVYQHHNHMWCWYTRGRFERTCGEEGEGGHPQFCLPKIAHVWLSQPMDVTYFQFENRSRTTRCRISLHLNTLFNSRHMTQRHTQTRTHTQHNHVQEHSTAQHNTAQHRTQHTEAKRREEEMKETKRDRDEKRYK